MQWSGGRRRARQQPMAEINLVPFIDVMLVLLIIFMITTPLLTQGVKVNLPETATAKSLSRSQEPLIVTVDAKGQFYLNVATKPGQPVTERVLATLAGQQLVGAANQQRPVLVRGDQQVNYGRIMEAMVILQQAGAGNVGLVTQAAPSKGPRG